MLATLSLCITIVVMIIMISLKWRLAHSICSVNTYAENGCVITSLNVCCMPGTILNSLRQSCMVVILTFLLLNVRKLR